ncbi:MAG TPA: PEP-CTERM sorting domain-containing protein [Tepidisphaeraceae bacterium]|jgi:MYXO-CTERM domain-containing protein
MHTVSIHTTAKSAVLSTLVLVCGLQAAASAAVMSFTGQPFGNAPAAYTENGIRLESSVTANLFSIGNPSPGYAVDANSAIVRFTAVDNSAFNFNSIDILIQIGFVDIGLVGTKADGGGTVSQSFPVSASGFTTLAPTGFTDLSRVDLTYRGNGFLFLDNVTVTMVPEPAALGLLGVATLALRRRRPATPAAC